MEFDTVLPDGVGKIIGLTVVPLAASWEIYVTGDPFERFFRWVGWS